ncbi:BON domain-containing protein [Luteimonas sp. JM171]|uniref:BON domain-containing protein n=1 Tax=Luteimonas sp. JM171 TaxID=1896164 RepID=UPI000856DF16|nr:BON domain-containing protein [Luteimonas sp. JM171]AOH35528.1 hypothetical protein BGP89_03460 [Luteimonas sp. JM171]
MNNITKNHSRTILAGALSAALMFAAGAAMAQEATQEHEDTAQHTMEQAQDRAEHERIQTSRDLNQDRDRTMGDEDGDVDGGVFDRDSDQPVNDTWITTKVKSSLLADSDVAGTEVDVETINGVVHLSGYVDDQRQIDRAVEIARDIEGVTNVESSGLQLKASDTD